MQTKTGITIGLLLLSGGLLLWNLALTAGWLRAQDATAEADPAAESAAGTQTLLQTVDERLRTESRFLVQIQFRESLIPGESTWVLGDRSDPYQRSITEIGSDYLCFGEAGGQAVFNRCTRYDNIVSINFFAPVE